MQFINLQLKPTTLSYISITSIRSTNCTKKQQFQTYNYNQKQQHLIAAIQQLFAVDIPFLFKIEIFSFLFSICNVWLSVKVSKVTQLKTNHNVFLALTTLCKFRNCIVIWHLSVWHILCSNVCCLCVFSSCVLLCFLLRVGCCVSFGLLCCHLLLVLFVVLCCCFCSIILFLEIISAFCYELFHLRKYFLYCNKIVTAKQKQRRKTMRRERDN